MTESTKALNDIDRRDRKYRTFNGAFVVTVILLLLVIIGLQARAISNSNYRAAQSRKNNAAILKKIQDQNDEQIRANKCFATLFAQKDRQDVQLTDLNGCVLQRGGGPISLENLSNGVAAASTPTVANPSTSTPAAISQKTDSNTSTQVPTASAQTSPPTLIERILGGIKRVL